MDTRFGKYFLKEAQFIRFDIGATNYSYTYNEKYKKVLLPSNGDSAVKT